MGFVLSSNDQLINIDGFTGLQYRGSLNIFERQFGEHRWFVKCNRIGEDILISGNDKVVDSRALWFVFGR